FPHTKTPRSTSSGVFRVPAQAHPTGPTMAANSHPRSKFPTIAHGFRVRSAPLALYECSSNLRDLYRVRQLSTPNLALLVRSAMVRLV
ncbi:hypothetical protein, partial [Sphingomonas albertensis]|uniref:hypothetical protein n=1 Tax=Sphingomonas albertensis TaxID=2762591 RepID=UPI001BE4B7E1